MKKLKIYYVCDGRHKTWYNCVGMLSNGFIFAQYMTMIPEYAPADLFVDRPSRQRALAEVFGIDPETIETEMFIVRDGDDMPEWWHDFENAQDSLFEYYERYLTLIDHKVRS